MLAMFWIALKARGARVYIDTRDKTTLYFVDGRSIMKFEGVSVKDAFLCMKDNLRLGDYEFIHLHGVTASVYTVPAFIAML